MWSQVIEEMVILYWPPFRASDEVELTYLAEVGLRAYVADLREFPSDVLRNGWAAARRAHRVERWPTIGAIRDQCYTTANPARSSNVAQLRGPEWNLWKVRMNGFPFRNDWWPVDLWGARPGQDGCKVPVDLIPPQYRPREKVVARSVIPDDAA